MTSPEASLAAGRRGASRTLHARLWLAIACLMHLILTLGPGAAHAQSGDDRHLAFAARIAGDAVRSRIVIDFESKPDFSLHYLPDPRRIIIDLPETAFGFPDDLEARGVFTSIRYGAMGPGRSRIVLTTEDPVEVEFAAVEAREEGQGYRLVVDAVATSPARFEELVSNQKWESDLQEARGDRVVSAGRENAFTVVIDPGHGGIDQGARGVTGTPEKEVTLAFSKAIAEKLAAYDNINVVLTRDDDRFIPLAGRVKIAREHEADLMISVHADSIRLPDIRGATVYTLSDKASDRMAAELARQENRADEIAGVVPPAEQEDVADILMDLTRRETQVLSVGLARAVLDELSPEVRLINNAHRYAGFSVLRAPDVPSVLVELGYLSNKEDEKLLNDPVWRDKTAGLLAEAIHGFRKQLMAAVGEL